MGVHVYIDGFNFYYRLFKNSGRKNRLPSHHKWLDLLKLSQQLAPGQTIDWIGYFTAYVRQSPLDPDQHRRQRAYLAALGTIPCLEIVPGKFQPTVKRGLPRGTTSRTVMEFDTFEGKGSDVNLASRLVWDAARGAFDEALVVSNDSDLAEAIRIATVEAGQRVRVFSPDITVSNLLRKVATDASSLDTKLFKRCLFPNTMTNSDGVIISRPITWAPPSRQHR